jgi:hypothetical protein
MRKSKEKSLPKWLVDELRLLGWKTPTDDTQGFAWVRDGVKLVITPANTARNYIVSREKMSGVSTSMKSEVELLTLIEGDSYE